MEPENETNGAKAATLKPPYASYTSFRNYIKKLSEGVIPSQIDRGVFGNQSGTYISQMIGTFEWFGLVNSDNSPSDKLKELVTSYDSNYNGQLKVLLNDSYEILRERKIDLKAGTEVQISKLFRDYGYSGSTLTKAVSFFLNACKDAGYEIGEHLKAPAPPRNGTSRGRRGRVARNSSDSPDDNVVEKPPKTPPGMTVIPVGLHGMQDGAIHLPANLNKRQWDYAVKMASFILENYHQDFDEINEEDD